MIKLLGPLLLFSELIYANDIMDTIKLTANRHNLCPKLVWAIAMTESSLNPNAIGQHGEIGLFQLRPEYHNVKYGDYKHNTNIAVKYLLYVKRRCHAKYKDAWFICYNTGPNRSYTIKDPKKFNYYKKVMKYYRQADL